MFRLPRRFSLSRLRVASRGSEELCVLSSRFRMGIARGKDEESRPGWAHP